jgi:hypothetical protein
LFIWTTAISKLLRASAFGMTCFSLVATVAVATCSPATLQSFIPQFKTARDEMSAHPAKSYADLTLLDQRISACRLAESDVQIRFKLSLVEVGLRAYIGAADASQGNVARGSTTAQAAMQDAKRLVRDNRTNSTNLQLAEQLVTQVERPLAIIGKLEPHKH